MNRVERINYLVDAIAQEVFGYITENAKGDKDGWVPNTEIKDNLNLKFSEYPKNKDQPAKGWLLGIALRILEDMDMIEYDNSGSRTFCRVKPQK